MTTINYIAIVDVNTGEINTVNFCGGGSWPDEGVIEGSDPPQQIFWIDEENWSGKDSHEILEEWYRKEDSWHHRGSRPNSFYIWNTTDFVWELNSEDLWICVRQIRLQKLQECDWTQLRDSNLTSEQLTAWQIYRQDLRDTPYDYSNVTSIDAITWPTPPS